MARRPAQPRRSPRSRHSTVASAPVAIVLILLGAIWLEREGMLPEGMAEVVREVEAVALEPLLAELGFEMPHDRPADTPRDGSVDIAQARALLTQIRVEPERRAGYVRENWPHWLDLDGDCMDTRDEVLRDESLGPARLSPDRCRVIGGRWRDAYTGETITDPTQLDIDHFVALQEVHDSGGHGWSREQRAAYANDLSDPRSLVAVTAAANRAKGASGPEEWLPPDPSYRCRYVADWIAVKARWRLSMDESERAAVENILEACEAGS